MDLRSVINGDGPPPSFVLELIQGFPPGSACEAARNKAPEMLGWDIASILLANISDWTQATMITAGNWPKNKGPKFRQEQRPWVEAKKRVDREKKDSEGVKLETLYHMFAMKAAKQGG